jgi:hypothetical protein
MSFLRKRKQRNKIASIIAVQNGGDGMLCTVVNRGGRGPNGAT